MPDEKTDSQDGKEGQGHDAALEALGARLADAAGKTDTGALKGIVQDFYRDAVDLRTRNRELTRENTQLKGRVKDGDLVLTGDEAKSWVAIQKTGIPAADISKRLTEGTAAQQKVAMFERDQTADKAAELAGYKPATLRQIVRLHNLNIQLQDVPDPSGARDEQGKVKKVRLPVVIPEGENAEAVPLTEYVDEHLGDFRDVLAGSEADRNGRREPPAPPGPRIVRQKSGEQGAGRGVPDEKIEAEIRSRHAGMAI